MHLAPFPRTPLAGLMLAALVGAAAAQTADGDEPFVVASAERIEVTGRHYDNAIGMWLGLIMAFNVWFIIWPNQKKALGIVPVEAAEKAAAAKLAGMTSRFNTMLSIPMLYCMVAQQNAGL